MIVDEIGFQPNVPIAFLLPGALPQATLSEGRWPNPCSHSTTCLMREWRHATGFHLQAMAIVKLLNWHFGFVLKTRQCTDHQVRRATRLIGLRQGHMQDRFQFRKR